MHKEYILLNGFRKAKMGFTAGFHVPLTLQELKFYFKYNEGTLPIYLQNWKFIMNVNLHNYNTRKIRTLHTFKTKHEFAKKMS